MASRKTVCFNCGPETVNISQGDAEGSIGSRGFTEHIVFRGSCMVNLLHAKCQRKPKNLVVIW
jgi:hypothetical protein